MAAKGGTGHLQVAVTLLDAVDGSGSQGGGGAQEVLVLGHVDVQVGAVGAQTGVQTGSQTGAQITADVGGTDEQDLGLVVVDQVADGLGVAAGGVVLQQGVLADIDAVSAVAAQLLGQTFHVVAQQNAVQLGAQLVSQLAALGDQLEGGGHHGALALLAEYPNAALELLDRGTVIARHILQSPFYQIRCLAASMPASLSQVARSAPSSIMPTPF